MFAKMHSDTMLKLKKWGYLAFWAAVLPLLPLSAFIGRESGTQDYWAWFLYFVVFGIIPVLDYIIGKDPSNPDEHQQVPSMSQERIYTSALFLMGFIWLGVLFFAGWVFVNNDYSLLGQLGWIVSIGTVGGIIAINLGHEFVHKDPKLENWMGGLLLSSVTYAGFKVEHVRGHHVHVSTPEDASSSQYNQGLYEFLPRAFVRTQRIDLWWDTQRHLIGINASSRKRAEDVLDLLRQTLGSLKVTPLATRATPMRAMTEWLSDPEKRPATLALGDQVELKAVSGDESVLRGRQIDLDGEEIQTALETGRQATRLAFTIDESLSLVLTDDLALKTVRFADALIDEQRTC